MPGDEFESRLREDLPRGHAAQTKSPGFVRLSGAALPATRRGALAGEAREVRKRKKLGGAKTFYVEVQFKTCLPARRPEWQGLGNLRGRVAQAERRRYPPDYVSAETLAYRLDCSRSTIDAYVRLGLLPKPESIGNLQRWNFGQVKAFIKVQNAATHEGQGSASGEEDAYLKGLKGGSAKKGER